MQTSAHQHHLPSFSQLLSACLCVALVLASSGKLLADSKQLKSEQQNLQTVRGQIAALQKELEQNIGVRGKLEQQLGAVEKQLDSQHRHLRKLQKQLRDNELKLKNLKSDQTSLYSSLQLQQSNLTAQLRTAYFMGNQEQLKILLSQQDPSALTRTLKYFEYLNRARLQVIESARGTLQEIEYNQIKIEKETKNLAILTKESAQKYKEIEKSRSERHQVLAKLRDDIKDNKISVVTLRQDETHIRELIGRLSGIFSDIPPETTSLPFNELKGLLPWPVNGKALNNFGDAQVGSDLSWRGIQITAPSGREVRAISHGRVAFADWLPVFGLILLIDHSNGYMSLYAHNQSLYKETGDWVRAGEVISNVGDSGGEERNMLYFEIRHNGKPLNPAKWCVSNRA